MALLALNAHLHYRALLFVLALFLALSSTGLTQVTLANFPSDQKQVEISLKTAAGKAIKLHSFPLGQNSSSFALDPHPHH
jgi:hypothetical protein